MGMGNFLSSFLGGLANGGLFGASRSPLESIISTAPPQFGPIQQNFTVSAFSSNMLSSILGMGGSSPLSGIFGGISSESLWQVPFGGLNPFSFISIIGGLGDFFNNPASIGLPNIDVAFPTFPTIPTTTTVNQPVSTNTSEVAAVLDAEPIAGDVSIDQMVKPLPGKKIDPAAVEALKADYENVPPEILELVQKNGTSIVILNDSDSLLETGAISKIDPEEAEIKKAALRNDLEVRSKANGFELDFGNLEISDFDGLRTQAVNELEKIYNVPNDLREEFREDMAYNNRDQISIQQYLDEMKENRENTDDPAKIAKYDKIIALEEILLDSYEAPVKYNEQQYVTMADYERSKLWDSGRIASCYYIPDKTIYLKESVLGKEFEGDVGLVSVHELGHALEASLADLSPEFANDYLTKMKNNYELAKEYDDDPSTLGNANAPHEFISAYASTDFHEYLAETFCAFFDEDENKVKLQTYDNDQYNTLASLFYDTNIAKEEAIVAA